MRLLVVRRLQTPPVIAMQLGALGRMDAPTVNGCRWVTEEQRTRMGISTGEGERSVQGVRSIPGEARRLFLHLSDCDVYEAVGRLACSLTLAKKTEGRFCLRTL